MREPENEDRILKRNWEETSSGEAGNCVDRTRGVPKQGKGLCDHEERNGGKVGPREDARTRVSHIRIFQLFAMKRIETNLSLIR